MNSLPKSANITRRRLRFVVPGVILFAAACASSPPIPTTNIQAAQQAISNAERVDAGTHAAAELGEARSKLSSAQQAVSEEKMLVAGQFADESRVEAELAAARTSAVKANAVNDDIKRGTATLVEEMQRKTGGTP